MITEDPVPFNALECSSDLKEIIKSLLEKDPAKRVTWEELFELSYWENFEMKEVTQYKFPVEPQFDSYLHKLGKTKRVPMAKKKKQEKL